MNRLLTVNDVSRILQISVCTIYRMTHEGEIPCIKIRHSVRFKERDIEILVARNTKKRKRKRQGYCI